VANAAGDRYAANNTKRVIRIAGTPEHNPEKWKPVFRKDHAQSKC